MNPKFPDREVPLGKRSRPGPARSNETSSRVVVVSSERKREKKKKKKKNESFEAKKKRTIGTPRSLLSERITKDVDDDDDDYFDDYEGLLRSPVGRRS